jgi:excisionase family DNA binding protein
MASYLIHENQLQELAKLIVQYLPDFFLEGHQRSDASDNNDIMSVDDLREFLPNRPSRSAIYGLTHRKKIPFHKPTGRHIYFLRSEIEEWVKQKHSRVPAEYTTRPGKARQRIRNTASNNRRSVIAK